MHETDGAVSCFVWLSSVISIFSTMFSWIVMADALMSRFLKGENLDVSATSIFGGIGKRSACG